MSRRIVVCCTLVLPLLPVAAAAQRPDWDPRRPYAAREALQGLAERFDAAAQSPAYSPALRAEARRQADGIRQRLAQGDFQVGDRLFLTVERQTTLTDTLAVVAGAAGPEVLVPELGAVSLSGVLRSEAEAHLREHVGRFVRDPVVRVRTFIRISIAGQVGRPAFYTVPTDLVITDALSVAEGVTAEASLSDIEIRRQNRVVWDRTALEEPIVEGRTLDQLDVRSGDQIVVGGKGKTSFGALESPLRALSILLAIPFTIVSLATLF